MKGSKAYDVALRHFAKDECRSFHVDYLACSRSLPNTRPLKVALRAYEGAMISRPFQGFWHVGLGDSGTSRLSTGARWVLATADLRPEA
jgi:hypothetical protein